MNEIDMKTEETDRTTQSEIQSDKTTGAKRAENRKYFWRPGFSFNCEHPWVRY